MRVVRKPAPDEPANGLDLVLEHGLGPSVHAHQLGDAVGANDTQALSQWKSGEAVAWEKWLFYFLHPVFPAAPALICGQEGLDAAGGQLAQDLLLVPRPCRHRIPSGRSEEIVVFHPFRRSIGGRRRWIHSHLSAYSAPVEEIDGHSGTPSRAASLGFWAGRHNTSEVLYQTMYLDIALE